MQSNVIEGKVITSSVRNWDFDFYIDTEDYHDSDTIFADVEVPEFNTAETNLTIQIKPNSIDTGSVGNYSDKEDGYQRYYSEWEEHPSVRISDSDLMYSDSGYEVSEQEFMQKTGLSKQELDDLRQQLVEVAPDYLEEWLEKNYDRFED